ncbi:hypothetical protein AALB53_14790 [Lachnospiraceae bacterium 47-T17]
MTRKKNGFWTLIFSLIPGAGEMYLGFMKRGVSLMSICLMWIAFCAWTGFEVGLFIVPVIWFYSFFHVHNLNSLPDEEFYQQEDYYMLFHIDEIVGIDRWERGKVKFIASVLIFVGGYTIVSTMWHTFWGLVPEWAYDYLSVVRYNVPRIVISVILIAFGIYLIRGKKEKLDEEPEVVFSASGGDVQEKTDAFFDRKCASQTDKMSQAKPEVIILGSTADEKKEG